MNVVIENQSDVISISSNDDIVIIQLMFKVLNLKYIKIVLNAIRVVLS